MTPADLRARAQKAATAVYIACEEPVARDLSDILTSLLAALDAAELDTQRLDWLESHKPGFALIADLGGPWQIEITVGERDECQSYEAPTYRAAIDAARPHPEGRADA